MLIRILVVNGSASDRLNMKNTLSEYCVLTACGAAEAMRMLEDREEIGLLVLDLPLSDGNGRHLLRTLKNDGRYRKLHTILLTEHKVHDRGIAGLRPGAVDCIRKPVSLNSLKDRIDLHAALLQAERQLEQRLNEHLVNFDMIFDQAPIGITILHGDGPAYSDQSVVRVNPVFEQITGRTREELLSADWTEITHPDDLEEDIRNFQRMQAGEIKSYSMDKRYLRPDGSAVWVHIIVAPLLPADDNEKKYKHICLVQDITGRKAMENALNESERSKSVLLSHLPGLAYRCNYDCDWTMQYVSEGCFALTGYPPESLLYNRDLSYNDIIAPEYHDALWEKWKRIIAARQPFKHEYEIITAAGERKWVLEMGQGIYDRSGGVEALEGIVLDISDRKAIENALKYNNEHDRLTGLYNRDYLVSLLEKDLGKRDGRKRALIGINLSMIQLLAANYGFQHAQNLTKKAAEALSLYCTETRLLFHSRENRFVFYLSDYRDRSELADFGNLIAEMLEHLFVTDRIGGRIGILELEQDREEIDVDFLLRKLLIASERSGCLSGREFEVCFYGEELEVLVNRERDIVEALTRIAANDPTGDALLLQYQPIVTLKTGIVCGFEALARLKTERLGPVSPLEFIPIAERTKLILPIGEKVIIGAFRFLNRLREQGYDRIGISINISVIQLLKPDFTSRLFQLMSEMQINPKNVCIEITESIFVSDFETVNRIIEELRGGGLYIALDDFGTGYSSLAKEKELNINFLKIDKYFIDQLTSPDLSKAITGDIISMAHKLGHGTIAEGVEHECQLEYLEKHDCDKIQGYLISKPLDEEAALAFLNRQGRTGRCDTEYSRAVER